MKKPKVYLETTLFNYYFDEDRDAHADTVTLFEECVAGRFEPYTSDYGIREIEDATVEKRDKMLDLLKRYDITILTASDETDKLAARYIIGRCASVRFKCGCEPYCRRFGQRSGFDCQPKLPTYRPRQND